MNQGTVAGVYAWSDKFMQTISSTMTMETTAGGEPYDIDVTGSGNSQVTTSALYTSLGLTPGVVTGGSNVVSTYLTNHGQIYNSTSDTHVNVNSSTQQWTPDMNTELGEMGITDGTFNVVNDGSIRYK